LNHDIFTHDMEQFLVVPKPMIWTMDEQSPWVAMGRTGHPPCPHVTGEILTCSISSLGCAGAIEPCQFSESLEK
jgi:hypothetical protein